MGKLGTLVLTYPKIWKEELTTVAEAGEKAVMTFDAIRFTPAAGSNFAFQIQIIPVGDQRATAYDIKAQLVQNGRGELTNSVEGALNIREFKGSNVVAGAFRVTDKRWINTPPPAGEFKYLTQGVAKLGPLILSFRLVANDLDVEPLALELVKSARIDK